MSNNHIVRAWKDAEYRKNLSEAERATLPAHPAGAIEISDADLGNIAGGVLPESYLCTFTCPTKFCSYICPSTVLICKK